jgi:hypothetical protein
MKYEAQYESWNSSEEGEKVASLKQVKNVSFYSTRNILAWRHSLSYQPVSYRPSDEISFLYTKELQHARLSFT